MRYVFRRVSNSRTSVDSDQLISVDTVGHIHITSTSNYQCPLNVFLYLKSMHSFPVIFHQIMKHRRRTNAKRWMRAFTPYRCSCRVFITSRTHRDKHQNCGVLNNCVAENPGNVVIESQEPINLPSTSQKDSLSLEGLANTLNTDLLNFIIQIKYKLMINEVATGKLLTFIRNLLNQVLLMNLPPWKATSFLNVVFGNLETSYYRQKAIESVLPVKPTIVGHWTYLSIRPQLQAMFEGLTKFRNSFHRSNIVRNLTDVMSSPLDGLKVAETLRNVESTYIVPIVIYFDEFCDVSAIGAFTKRNKLSILEWRAVGGDVTSNNCFLLSFAKSNDFNHCKTTELNNIILKVIEETSFPLQFTVNGEQIEYCSIVPIFICADNLASHQLLGLFESFSAKMPCSQCLVPKSLFAHVTRENETGVRLRTAAGTVNAVKIISETVNKVEKDDL